MAALCRQFSYPSLHVLSPKGKSFPWFVEVLRKAITIAVIITSSTLFFYACLRAHTKKLKNQSCMSRKKRMWGWQPASAECWVLLCCQWSASLAEEGESHASAHSPPCSCTCCWPSLRCSFIRGNSNPYLETQTENLREPKPELRVVGDLPLPPVSPTCAWITA